MADISKIELEDVVYDIKDTTARSDISTLSSALNNKISNVMGKNETKLVIYIDNDNGSDDNDGLTAQAPLKNLDTVFTKYGNKGNLNLWLTFFPGDYELHGVNLNNSTIHWMIRGNTSGSVTIKFYNPLHASNSDEIDFAFYQCHCKFVGKLTSNNQKMILKGTSSCRRIYFDSGGLAIEDGVELQDLALAFHYSGLEANKSVIPELQLSDSCARVENYSKLGLVRAYCSRLYTGTYTTITQDRVYGTDAYQINMYQSDWMISGIHYVDVLETPTINGFLRMTEGTLILRSAFNKQGSTNSYPGNNIIDGAIIVGNQNRVNALKAVATTNSIDADCISSPGVTL